MPSSPQVVPVVVLFDYLLSDTGVGMNGQRVTVVLNSTAPATSVSPPTVIAQVQQSTTTDQNGYWQFSLVPNTNISPANTTYTVLTPAGTYDVTLGAVGPYQSTALGTIVNVPVPLTAPAPSSIPSLLVGAGEPGIDTVGAGALLLGDNTATSVEIGSGAVPVTINGQVVAVSSTGVQINAAGDISARSLTLSSSGPYAPLAGLPVGALEGQIFENGGFAYNIMNPALASGGVQGNGTDESAKINTALTAIPAASIVYWPTPPTNYGIGATITPKANMTLRGSGRFSSVVKRLNSTNAKMFALEGLVGITVEDMGFDCNGANQSSNQECLRFSAACDNLLVQRVNFINVAAFGMFIFGGPTSRALNPRFWYSDVTPISGVASDLVTMIGEGGSTVGIRIHSGHTAACINIYEANSHPCIGCTPTLSGNGAIGIACSSVHRCPIIGATITLGANDIGISVLKETDNPSTARSQLDQSITACTIVGSLTGSVGYKLTSCSNTHIKGGSLDTVAQGVQYAAGTIVGVSVDDVEFINVTNPWIDGVTPQYVRWSRNPGVNPFGQLVAPAVPATGVDAINSLRTDSIFYVLGGTVTALKVGQQAPPILLLSTAPTGGTLVPGTYAYRVTMVDQQGGETLASTEVTIVVPAGTNTNTVTVLFYQPMGALRGGSQVSFKVYGRTTGAELLMVSALVTNTWTDTGAITPAGALPTTNGSARAIGTLSGPVYVPANQTIQWTGTVAPTWTAQGLN